MCRRCGVRRSTSVSPRHISRLTLDVLTELHRVIVFAALRLHFVELEIDSTRLGVMAAFTTLSQQLELGYGIMASTMPTLKPFIAAYDGPHPSRYLKGSTTEATGNAGYRLSRYRNMSSTNKNSDRSNPSMGEPPFRPDHPVHRTTVSHNFGREDERNSMGSDDSRRAIIPQQQQPDLIIRKDVEWTVETNSVSAEKAGTTVEVVETGHGR